MYQWTPADLDTLIALSRARGIDPVSVALLLYIESAGFNPASPGPADAVPAVGGLNQMSAPNLLGLGLTRPQWLAFTAAQQLPYVFKFWDGLVRDFGGGHFPASAAGLLALNFVPEYTKEAGALENPDAPIVSTTLHPGLYKRNAYYDPEGTGAITVNTIAKRQMLDGAAAGSRWNQLAADIRARAGGPPGSATPPTGTPIASVPPPSSMGAAALLLGALLVLTAVLGAARAT